MPSWLTDEDQLCRRRLAQAQQLSATNITPSPPVTLPSTPPSKPPFPPPMMMEEALPRGRDGAPEFGGFLSRIFSAGAARADGGKPSPSPDWDVHGLAASALPVPLSRLDGKKRYKVSELNFLDRRTRAAAAEDPLFVFDDDMPALRPGGVYTRSQLRDELDALTSSSMFDHVTFQTKPKPDGTLGLTVFYAETEWPAVEQFKCINLGGLMARPDNDKLELEDDMTARERMDYLRR